MNILILNHISYGICNTLQYVATHCNTLQHTATRCNTLQHVATYCNTLQHTAPFCNTLQRAAGLETLRLIVLDCINTLQRTATPHAATHCIVLKHTAGLKKLQCIVLDEANRLRFVVWRGGGLGSSTIREVGGWGRVPFSRNLMSPTPRRKWYLTTGRRAH